MTTLNFSKQRGRPLETVHGKRPRDASADAPSSSANPQRIVTAAVAAPLVNRSARSQIGHTARSAVSVNAPQRNGAVVCPSCAAISDALSHAVEAYENAFDAARTALVESTLRHASVDEQLCAILRSCSAPSDVEDFVLSERSRWVVRHVS